MKKNLLLLIIVLVVFSFNTYAQLTSNNIVVVRVGDGVTSVDSKFSKVFLDEYTQDGTFVSTINLPTATVGSNFKFALSSNTTGGVNEAQISLSADGTTLVVPGYDAADRDATVTNKNPSTFDIVIATIKADGVVNTSTKIPKYTATQAPNTSGFVNSAYLAADNSTIYYAGSFSSTTNSAGGILKTTLGSTAAPTSLIYAGYRQISLINGDLYGAQFAATNAKLVKVNLAVPASGATVTALPGLNNGSGRLFSYYFADLNPTIEGIAGTGYDVLYISDDIAGLTKYSYDAVNSTWVSNGVIGAADAYRYFTGKVSLISGSKHVTLFSARKQTSASPQVGELVKVVDNKGYNDAFDDVTVTVLHTFDNATEVTLRGVSFTPGSVTTLPITLKDFKATEKSGKVEVKWSTSSEINNSYFELFRANDDKIFNSLAVINGSGNSSKENSYSFTDLHPKLGNNYYRLKQFDFDGKSETFNQFDQVVKINSLADEAKLSVYASKENIQLFFNLNSLKNIDVSIYDLQGKVLIKDSFSLNNGSQVTIPNSLNTGVYIVKVSGAGINLTEQFLIK